MTKLIKIYSEQWGMKRFGWHKGARWSIFWDKEKEKYWIMSQEIINEKGFNMHKNAQQAKEHIIHKIEYDVKIQKRMRKS